MGWVGEGRIRRRGWWRETFSGKLSSSFGSAMKLFAIFREGRRRSDNTDGSSNSARLCVCSSTCETRERVPRREAGEGRGREREERRGVRRNCIALQNGEALLFPRQPHLCSPFYSLHLLYTHTHIYISIYIYINTPRNFNQLSFNGGVLEK